jgi:hypothetical protein
MRVHPICLESEHSCSDEWHRHCQARLRMVCASRRGTAYTSALHPSMPAQLSTSLDLQRSDRVRAGRVVRIDSLTFIIACPITWKVTLLRHHFPGPSDVGLAIPIRDIHRSNTCRLRSILTADFAVLTNARSRLVPGLRLVRRQFIHGIKHGLYRSLGLYSQVETL